MCIHLGGTDFIKEVAVINFVIYLLFSVASGAPVVLKQMLRIWSKSNKLCSDLWEAAVWQTPEEERW